MIWLDFKITRESEERKLHFSYFKCELFELLLEKIKNFFVVVGINIYALIPAFLTR